MLRSLSSALLLLSAVSLAGCPYGNGSPCEQNQDCASGVCCGRTPTVRGVCRPTEDMACLSIITDAGTLDGSVEDTGVDAPEDTGADTGEDVGAEEDAGTDAGSDAGSDAGPEDAGTDAPTDAGTDAG